MTSTAKSSHQLQTLPKFNQSKLLSKKELQNYMYCKQYLCEVWFCTKFLRTKYNPPIYEMFIRATSAVNCVIYARAKRVNYSLKWL